MRAREKTVGVINSLSKMRELLRVRTVDAGARSTKNEVGA
jgi:hypothetical protein